MRATLLNFLLSAELVFAATLGSSSDLDKRQIAGILGALLSGDTSILGALGSMYARDSVSTTFTNPACFRWRLWSTENQACWRGTSEGRLKIRTQCTRREADKDPNRPISRPWNEQAEHILEALGDA
jgi:hypothetical protein